VQSALFFKHKHFKMSAIKNPKSSPTSKDRDSSPVRKARKTSSSSSNDSEHQATYRLFSDRRKRYLGKSQVRKNGEVAFPLDKPHYPRMDGCNYNDFQKGEKIYLKMSSDGEERTVSKLDLAQYNLFDDPNWKVDDDFSEENDYWADPDEDDDYDPKTSQSIARFIEKLEDDEATLEHGSWYVVLRANRENNQIFIKRITVKIPSSKKAKK
jgi:hypothetical protein